MTTASCIAVLCTLFALSSAAPSAEVQWHATAPQMGCVEVAYTAPGSGVPSRAQICDAPSGACILTTQPECGQAALFAREDFRRVINVRGREHVFLFFVNRGQVCWFSMLQQCGCPPTFPLAQNMPLHDENEIIETEIQWHASAPAQGCVGVSYRRAGTTVDSRAYFCDFQQSCVYTFEPQCPRSVFFAPVIDFQRIINIRGREHIFRFYNEIGGVCFYSPLPLCRCNPLVMEGGHVGLQEDEDCHCETLPNGEKICDPYQCDQEGGHVGLQEDEDCKCETLPNGEKICDPWQCDQEGGHVGLQEDDDCHCETLPNGEKICDPWQCDKEGTVNTLQQMIHPFVKP